MIFKAVAKTVKMQKHHEILVLNKNLRNENLLNDKRYKVHDFAIKCIKQSNVDRQPDSQ